MDKKPTSYEGKGVLLIGAADSLSVDDPSRYDIIVRINNSYPVPDTISNITSKRCDVIYIHYSILSEESWRDIGEVRIRLNPTRYSKLDTVTHRYRRHVKNLQVISLEYIQSLWDEIGCKPNSGILAIKEIIDQDPEELFITGISFYKTPFHKDYGNSEAEKKVIMSMEGFIKGHDQDKQLDWFVKNIYHLPNVTVDSVLHNICKHYGSE